MRYPDYFNEEAKTFYKKYSKICRENKSLNESTEESFFLLCHIWSKVITTDPMADSKEALKFNGLIKQYTLIAKLFGLVPEKAPQPIKKSLKDLLKNAI